MRTLIYQLLRLLYRFRAFNTAVLNTRGPVLLLANHVSWWDWLLIGVCLDPDWRFVTSSTAAEVSWFHKRIMVNRRTFPIDTASPYAVKRMAEYLQSGGRLVIFAIAVNRYAAARTRLSEKWSGGRRTPETWLIRSV